MKPLHMGVDIAVFVVERLEGVRQAHRSFYHAGVIGSSVYESAIESDYILVDGKFENEEEP